MLYVEFNVGPLHSRAGFEWHIGEKVHANFRRRMIENPMQINSVEADGDELDWLRDNMLTGIPFNKNRVQTWHGDFAKFIACSLPFSYQDS